MKSAKWIDKIEQKKSSKINRKAQIYSRKKGQKFEMSSDEAPAVSGKYRLSSGCFNYFRKQQKQSRCHLFDANFGQLVKKSRIYNFAKGWKILKLTIFTFLLQVICNWNNSSRVRELARRMERSQSRARWHSQTRFSGEILKLKSTKTTKNKIISNF